MQDETDVKKRQTLQTGKMMTKIYYISSIGLSMIKQEIPSASLALNVREHHIDASPKLLCGHDLHDIIFLPDWQQ